eukprot:3633016-Rhodomonas_salina.4
MAEAREDEDAHFISTPSSPCPLAWHSAACLNTAARWAAAGYEQGRVSGAETGCIGEEKKVSASQIGTSMRHTPSVTTTTLDTHIHHTNLACSARASHTLRGHTYHTQAPEEDAAVDRVAIDSAHIATIMDCCGTKSLTVVDEIETMSFTSSKRDLSLSIPLCGEARPFLGGLGGGFGRRG